MMINDVSAIPQVIPPLGLVSVHKVVKKIHPYFCLTGAFWATLQEELGKWAVLHVL